MSKLDGRCSYCNAMTATPIEIVFDGIACSAPCERALSWLLDGASTAEVHEEWLKETTTPSSGATEPSDVQGGATEK